MPTTKSKWSLIKKYFRHGNPHLATDKVIRPSYKLVYDGNEVWCASIRVDEKRLWVRGVYDNYVIINIEDLDLKKLEVYKKL